MSEYIPDKWIILKITKDGKTIYKVLASWKGGFLSGDSWRLNSGIVEVKKNGKFLEFYGNSGSVYKCHENYYGATGYTWDIYDGYKSVKRNKGELDYLLVKDARDMSFWDDLKLTK